MTRLLRWATTLCSLAVAGFAAVLWYRSATVGDHPSLCVRRGSTADPDPSFLIYEIFSTRAGLTLRAEQRGFRPAVLGANHWAYRQRTYWDWHTWSPPGGMRAADGPIHRRLGFSFHHQPRQTTDGSWTSWITATSASCPHWFPVALGTALPLLHVRTALRSRRRRWRIAHGLCPNCGYDLRATPDAGGALLPRCPECGREVHSNTTTNTKGTKAEAKNG